MNVDKINLKLSPGVQKGPQSVSRRQYFTGTGNHIPSSIIKREINELQSPFMKWMNKFENNIGEFQDICINAFGTGLLAPMFIKYNPLSKTDEDTRTYSAWRQPVSAVLAIGTQGAITIPFTRLIKNMSNNGSLWEDCNRTPFQDTEYITKQIKKLNPKATPQKIQELVNAEITKQENELLKNLREKNTINYRFAWENKPKQMSAEKYKDLLLKTVEEMKSNEEKQLKRFNNEKLPKRIERSEFYRKNYNKVSDVLNTIKTEVADISDSKQLTNIIKNHIKKLKTQKEDKELLSMLNETIDLAEVGKEELIAKLNKMLSHANIHKDKTSIEEVRETVNKNAQREIKRYNDSIDFLKDIENKIKDNKVTVEQIEEMFRKHAQEFKDDFRLKDKIFAEEVMTKLKDLTKKRIDGLKRISTLLVALAMLPVTCSLLNWIYPRFMDAVFPNLSNKKHDNESKDLVDKATKNSEVK